MQRNFPFYQGMLLKYGAGSLLGYFGGIFFRQVSRILLFYAGMASSFLAWLHWADYITINFRKIDTDIFHLVSKVQDSEQRGYLRDFKKMVTHVLPLVGGFTVSFWYAFVNG